MTESRKRLGRGLDALLSSSRLDAIDKAAVAPNVLSRTKSGDYIADLPLAKITHNPHQPRQSWDDAKLAELAESIKANGLVQPVIVRALGQGYQLIAGERRLRASKLAGKENIAAIIRDASEEQMLEWALIENIHRDDLNPLERARAYQQYIKRFSLNQEQTANRLGEDRSTISNYMRLLELPHEIQDLLNASQISMGHARALLALSDKQQQIRLAAMVVSGHLSVRALEKIIQQKRNATPATPKEKNPHIVELEQELTRTIGTKVTINTAGRKQHRGKIIIDFYSLDDFDRIRQRLEQP